MTEVPTGPIYATIDGPLVLVGFGSIARGVLPLVERHIAFDRSKFYVLTPFIDDAGRAIIEKAGGKLIQKALERETYRETLEPILKSGGRGFLISVSVDVSSLDLMRLCREVGCLYIDTVVEPWAGFYFDKAAGPEARTNNAKRNTIREEKARSPGGCTAVSCCGANPGMVSWFVKQALVNLAKDMGREITIPKAEDREGWAKLMHSLGVKGVHIAERDTQRAKSPKPLDVFVNTWSVEGFIAEGFQPAELGWGTHERWLPANGHLETIGCKSGAYLLQPGGNTRVRTWCPTPGAQYGYLVTHNESISISDFFTVREGDKVVFRPTVHYAYHPADDAVLSLDEIFGKEGVKQSKVHILREDEILDGMDELGVLLYGHEKNAYWFGSQLSIEDTRRLASQQNATALQVTSAILAGMVWAIENPTAGIVEADEMDFARCLEIQLPYVSPVKGFYTDWTPLTNRPGLYPEDIDPSDPWQFRNVLVH